MKADLSRDTYRADARFRTVVFQQGRVPLDAELNEAQDILAGRDETQLRDLVGPAGGPQDNAGFGLSVAPDGRLIVGAGHYYVEGVLAQAFADVPITAQPDLPGLVLPVEPGVYLAYLDVWIDHVTALEESRLREVALLGVETASRQRVVAQVRLARLDPDALAVIECSDPLPVWDALVAPPTGRLAARAEPQQPPPDACTLTPGAGYRRLENQLYRVEIHDPGDRAGATFKWSRDNASVAVAWTDQNGNDLTVARQPRDPLQAFAPGQWIELIDRTAVLAGNPGTLVRLVAVDGPRLTVDPATATGPLARAAFPDRPVVRRWDSAGSLDLEAGANADGFLALEDGVEVRFAPGTYHRGDHWLVPARTVTGDVEWPRDPVTQSPVLQPRHGTRHRYARLALLAHAADGWHVLRDCRRIFPPLANRCGCCSVSVGDGIRSHGDFDELASAVASLPPSGGTVCLLPGEHRVAARFEDLRHVTFHGCGNRSRLVPGPDRTHAVLLAFRDCEDIVVRDLAFDDPEGTCLFAEDRSWNVARGLVVERCEFVAGRSGIVVERVEQVRIERCLVDLTRARRAPGAAISLRAVDAVLRDNRVLGGTVRGTAAGEFPVGWGGLHLRAGSSRVAVLENHVEGGAGHGITLGGSLDAFDRLLAGLDPARTDDPESAEFTDGFAPRTVNLRQPQSLFVVVDRSGRTLPDVPISLEAPNRSELSLADERGEWLARIAPGQVQVSLGQGHRLVRVQPRRSSGGIDVIRLVAEPASLRRRAASDLDAFRLGPSAGTAENVDAARRDLPYRELDEALPLSEIRIENNVIHGCGLSGIGVLPHADASRSRADRFTENTQAGAFVQGQLADRLAALLPDHPVLFRSPVRDLVIAGNRISETFRAPLVPALSPRQFGYGGITLGSVSRARLVGNRILAFGNAHAKPVCGIFILHAEGLEIAENQIRADAPRTRRSKTRGFAGGIVCRFAFEHRPTPPRAGDIARPEPGVSEAPCLLVVRDNVVSVPCGRALTIGAFGSLRCQDNVLESNLPGFNPVDLLVGNSLVLNLGGFLDFLRVRALGKPGSNTGGSTEPPPGTASGGLLPATRGYRAGLLTQGVARLAYRQPERRLVATEGFRTFAPGNDVEVEVAEPSGVDLSLAAETAELPGLFSALFGASTRFQGNQLVSGPDARSLVDHGLVTFGDLLYADNHGTCQQLRVLPAHAALVGTSVRTSGNRLVEAHSRPGFSLLSLAFGPSATTGNQFDRCFVAATAGYGGLPALASSNQVLLPQFCSKLVQNPVAAFAQLAAEALGKLSETPEAVPEFNAASLQRDLAASLHDGETVVRADTLPGLHRALAATVVARDVETRAVEAVFGPDRAGIHAGTRRASEHLPVLDAIQGTHQLLAGLDAAATEPQPAHAAVVEGRLTYADGRGVPGLSVRAETSDGRALPVRATSQEGGVFRLALDPKLLPGGGRVPVEVRLAVHDATDRLLHRSTQSVRVVAGGETLGELPLPRTAFLPPPKSSGADLPKGSTEPPGGTTSAAC